MKACRWSFTLLFLVILSGALHAEGFRPQRLVPLPLVECQRLLERRFRDAGYEVENYPLDSSRARMTAVRGAERWLITFQPHSVFATEIDAQCLRNGIPDEGRLAELMSFLDRRAAEPFAAEQPQTGQVPGSVASLARCVVCIDAHREARPIQLSGFFIDPEGRILTTAHDLKPSQSVSVRLSGGETIGGQVIRIAPRMDLALIRTSRRSPDFIGPARGRLQLSQGETVCTIGCPQNAPGTFHEGVVTGPPRIADDQPLWQVHLRTLPGSSGSPAFDADGNLIGLIRGRYRGTETVGFLIPISTILEFLKK
ncbi:MAG: S1C family serine protease [Syntrophobacteraceae bacterium]